MSTSIKMKGLYAKVTPEMVKAINEIVQEFGYPSQGEAVRTALRDFILSHTMFKREVRKFRLAELVEEICEM